MSILRLIAVLLFSLFFSINGQAATNVLGTYSGTLSGNKTPGGAFSDSVIITIDTQSGTTISGSISFGTVNLTTTFSGNVQAGDIIDVIFNASATVAASGGFAGAFTGTSLVIPSGAGSLVIFGTSPTASYDVGGTLVFTSATSEDEDEDVIEEIKTSSGTDLKSSATIRTEINSITTPVHAHLQKTLRGKAQGLNSNESSFIFEGENGLNAGDLQLGNLGVWINYNYSSIENDFSRTAFESDSHNIVGGADFSLSDDYVLGIAVSYEKSDTDTLFNQGNLVTDGVTVVPYLGVLFSEHWSMDASIGYSWLANDQHRLATGTSTRIDSDPNSNRWFYSMNLNGVTFYNNWVIGGRVGVLYAENEIDSFVESDGSSILERKTTLGEFLVGGDVAYSFDAFEPFVALLYESDFIFDEIEFDSGVQAANDRNDILFSGGFRYFGNQGLTANFEYSKRLLREQFDEDSIRMTLRFDW